MHVRAHRDRWLTLRLVLLTLVIIVVGIAAGAITAWAMPSVPAGYAAVAEILYLTSEAQQGNDQRAPEHQLSAQLTLLKSRAVLDPVAQRQGRQFDDLQKDVDASVAANNIIRVQARDATEPAAMQTLQAVIDGYLTLANQPTGTTRYLKMQLSDAQANTQQLQNRVTQLTAAVLAGTASQTSLNDARAQLNASVNQEKAIQAQIDAAALTAATARVLKPPYSVPLRTTPFRIMAVSVGPLVGLLTAGVLLAVSAMRASRRPPQRQQVHMHP